MEVLMKAKPTNKLCKLRKGRNSGRLGGLGVSVTKKWI